MLPRKTTLLLVVLFICIIVFDALQHKFYIERFNLCPSNISFTNLLKNHLIRWMIWGTLAIPFSIVIWKKFLAQHDQISNIVWFAVFGFVILCSVLAIVLITIQSMIELGTPFNSSEFNHVFIFFVYQKGLAFAFTFFALMLILFNQSKGLKIVAQTVTIEHLEKSSSVLKEALKSTLETEPHLDVKTGYKMKPIPLSEIKWIQSDDYCVKIHTTEKSFTLRQSLKELERKLAHHQFIRIHRGALLNLKYLDQINFEASTLRLSDQTNLPLSKSGIQVLKKHLQETSI